MNTSDPFLVGSVVAAMRGKGKKDTFVDPDEKGNGKGGNGKGKGRGRERGKGKEGRDNRLTKAWVQQLGKGF